MVTEYKAKLTDPSKIRTMTIGAYDTMIAIQILAWQKSDSFNPYQIDGSNSKKGHKIPLALTSFGNHYNRGHINFKTDPRKSGVKYSKNTLEPLHTTILPIFKNLRNRKIEGVTPCIEIVIKNAEANFVVQLKQALSTLPERSSKLDEEPEQPLYLLLKADYEQIEPILSLINNNIHSTVTFALRIEIKPQHYDSAENVLLQLQQDDYISKEFCSGICEKFPMSNSPRDTYTNIIGCSTLVRPSLPQYTYGCRY